VPSGFLFGGHISPSPACGSRLAALDQVSADGIAFDVAQGDPKMPRIQRTGVETALEEMAGPSAACVEIERIAAVGAAQGDGQGRGFVRDGDQVHVIGHQAIGEDAQARLLGVGLKAVEISVAVGVSEEDALLVDAALGDVMRHSHGYGARESSHMLRKWSAERISLRGSYLSVPGLRLGACGSE
jgi:hypothetical protein